MYFQHLSTTWTIWNYCAKPNQKAPAPIWGWSQWCLQLVSTTDWWRFWGSVSNHRTMDFFVEPKNGRGSCGFLTLAAAELIEEKSVGFAWFRLENLRSRHVNKKSILLISRLYHTLPSFSVYFLVFFPQVDELTDPPPSDGSSGSSPQGFGLSWAAKM